MNKSLLCLGAVTLIGWLIGLTSAPSAASAAAQGCNPTQAGYFYAAGELPEPFKDFDHILIHTKQAGARRGTYTAAGKAHPFAVPDPYFERFATAAVDGISYSFSGRLQGDFFIRCDLEQAFLRGHLNAQTVVLEGRLQKFRRGAPVAETFAQFTYLPKARDAMADVNAPYPSGRSELIYAVERRDLAGVRDLLARGAKVDYRDGDDKTALSHAVFWAAFGNAAGAETVEALLAAGADPNTRDNYGWTVLMAAARGALARVVEKLLAAGADARARDPFGNTALLWAAKELVRSGTDPVTGKPYPAAATPDWRAARAAAILDITRALMRAGADVNARNQSGDTALSLTLKHRRASAGAADGALDGFITLLRQAGAQE